MAVYFIRAGDAGPVKIGSAVDVAHRMRELQIGNHLPLALVREIEQGNRAVELWLHERFSALRVRGEWFEFHAEMLAVVPPRESDLISERKEPRLREWIRQSGRSLRDVAMEIGVPLRTFCRYANHERLPRGETMAAIVRATNGAVRPNDFFDAVPADPAEAA